MLKDIVEDVKGIQQGYVHAAEVVQSAKTRISLFFSGQSSPADLFLGLQLYLDMMEYRLARIELHEAYLHNEGLDNQTIGMILYRITHRKDTDFMNGLYLNWSKLREVPPNDNPVPLSLEEMTQS